MRYTTPGEIIRDAVINDLLVVRHDASFINVKIEGGKTMTIPKPSEVPAAKKQVESVKEPKKPFVRKPHLTQRPFISNPNMVALRQQMRGR